MSAANKRTQILSLAGGGMILLILCLTFLFHRIDHTKQLRFGDAAVEFVTDGEIITCVTIRGKFPYLNIVPKLPEERTIDTEGNVTEVYTVEANISLNTGSSMKLFLETSEEVTHTYILQFADKNVIISNGKVVE